MEICGDKEAVEKATKLVNEYLMKNCTNKIVLKQHELYALTRCGSKFLKLFQRKSDATIILEKQSSATVLFVVGPRESAQKLKEELYDFFGSAQVLLLTQNEKQTLQDGGKNCPLKDLSNQVEVVSIFNNLYLHVYGPEKAREKATTLVKKYLCFKNASK